MNYFIIILGIIVALIIYYVYTIVTAIPTIIKSVDLTKKVENVPSTSITDPYSINYTIGVWVYVSQYSSQIGRFLMFGDKNREEPLFSLRMDTNGNNLYADILVNKRGTIGETKILPVLLNSAQDSFPIQKWVYVVVTATYNYVEAYLNGKFITAVNISNNSSSDVNGIYQATPPKDPNAGATFTFGGVGSNIGGGKTRDLGCPIILSQLSRWNEPLTAGDVYNNYLKGNGEESSLWGPSYHMDINVTQDKNSYVLSVF